MDEIIQKLQAEIKLQAWVRTTLAKPIEEVEQINLLSIASVRQRIKIKPMELPQPKTNTQEVLYHLITYGHVSIMDFPYLSGFRTKVSELRNKHEVIFGTTFEKAQNKFGNYYTYAFHKLPVDMKDKAISIYKQMIKN